MLAIINSPSHDSQSFSQFLHSNAHMTLHTSLSGFNFSYMAPRSRLKHCSYFMMAWLSHEDSASSTVLSSGSFFSPTPLHGSGEGVFFWFLTASLRSLSLSVSMRVTPALSNSYLPFLVSKIYQTLFSLTLLIIHSDCKSYKDACEPKTPWPPLLPFLVLEPTSATHTHGHILYLISTNNCNSKISVAFPTTVFTPTRSTPMLAISWLHWT